MGRIAVRFGFDAIVIAGVMAGIILVVFELLASGFLRGSEAAALPLRMVAATALGSQALNPAYSLVTAVMTGTAIYLVLSIAFTVDRNAFGEDRPRRLLERGAAGDQLWPRLKASSSCT